MGNLLRKHIKHFRSAIIILFVLSFIIAINVISKPSIIEEAIIDNRITENALIKNKVDVLPCSLYPEGGEITPEGYIISNISKALIINVQSDILSDKSVNIQGNVTITYKIIAENLWERSHTLASVDFKSSGESIKLTDDEYRIDLQQLTDSIKHIEEDTAVKPNKYYIKIIPTIVGDIDYNGKIIPISPLPETTFEIISSYIRIINDTQVNNPYEIFSSNVVPFERKQVSRVLIGNVPVNVLKPILVFLSIILLIAVIVLNRLYGRYSEGIVSESDEIRRKYKGRLIFMEGSLECEGKSVFHVQSFKSLIRIADEKESSIACVKELDVSENYYVLDGNCVYIYKSKPKTYQTVFMLNKLDLKEKM